MTVIERATNVTTPDGTTEALLFQPEGDGPWPGVLDLPDIGSIRPASAGMARRLAAAGFVVLLPNPFYRVSTVPAFPFERKAGDERTMQRFAELVKPLTPEALVRDGIAYLDFLANEPAVARGPMGVLGYCFGGGMALRLAAARPEQIAAAASFHGGNLATDDPASPHTLLPHVKARLYFGHASDDRSMPKEAIAKLDAALAAWGGAYESETYEGAHHSWTLPDSPVYNEPQAERAFAKLLELLNATLR